MEQATATAFPLAPWRRILRALAVLLSLASVALFLRNLPGGHAFFLEPCGGSCISGRLSASDLALLEPLGLSYRHFAGYIAVQSLITMIGYVSVGGLILWRRPYDLSATIAAVSLIIFGTLGLPDTNQVFGEPLIWRVFTAWGLILGYVLFPAFLLTFPNGRFVPRWGWALLLPWTAFLIIVAFVKTGPTDVPYALFLTTFVGLVIFKYRRHLTPREREQGRWVMLGICAGIGGLILSTLVLPMLGSHHGEYFWLAQAIKLGARLCMLLIPASIAVAIFRSGLWDMRLLLNRALVYGALTAIVVGFYVLSVGYVSSLLQGWGGAISLLATGVIALAFAPLRDTLQQFVNRLFYGERYEPYSLLTRLARRIEATLTPDEMLGTIAATLQEALKLSYAAVAIRQEDEYIVAASVGQPGRDHLHVPVLFQGEQVGELILGPRAPGEEFTAADRRLFAELARQTAAAAYSVRLTAELQRSRERLVNAREEERRRLRRDLHDGLGPTLAAQSLKIGSARYLYRRDPVTADRLLEELENEMEGIIGTIKRLVYNLRPPALDEVGLLSAIRADASRYGPEGLRISVEAPETLPVLPAAVEVAALRIAQEALTNVVRHARARSARVRLVCHADNLHLSISDDGVGLRPERPAGVGLHSMRERAEELGGTFEIGPGPAGGTLLSVQLPLTH